MVYLCTKRIYLYSHITCIFLTIRLYGMLLLLKKHYMYTKQAYSFICTISTLMCDSYYSFSSFLIGAFGKVYKGYLNQSLVRRLSISVNSQKALTRQRGDSVLTVAIKTIKS